MSTQLTETLQKNVYLENFDLFKALVDHQHSWKESKLNYQDKTVNFRNTQDESW